MICLPRIAFLSSFGRETSLVNIMGPRSIFPPLFTPSIYFLLLLLVVVTTIIISCVRSFVNSKAGGIDNPSVLVGSKVICCCVQVHVKRHDTYLYLLESYWSILNLKIFAKRNLLLRYISPSTWGNQRGTESHQANLWRRCRG